MAFHCPDKYGAIDGIRTRDPQLGKLMLYQLSYYRVWYGKVNYFSLSIQMIFFFLQLIFCFVALFIVSDVII
jgi:hypothetical protein